MIARRTLALLVALACAAGAARADEAGPDDAKVGRALQDELAAHGGDVHGCWGIALAAEPKLAGELLMRLQIQPDGSVSRAEVLKDEVGSGRLTGCLVDAMRRWKTPKLAGSAPQQVVFPLAFKPDPPARIVVPQAEGKPGPLPGGKLEARVLVAESTVGPTKASLTLLTLKPSARLALHQHPGALEILYVLKGRAHLGEGRPGDEQIAEAGDAITIDPGVPHSLKAAPLAPLELVQLFVAEPDGPGLGAPIHGPEHGYLDPKDRAGTVPASPPGPRRAELTVIWAVPSARVHHAPEKPPLAILGGKGHVQLLLDGSHREAASLQRLEAEAGAVVPVHQHPGADELIYLVSGRVEMTVAGKPYPAGAGDAVHIPADTQHGLKVIEKLVAVQCYAPAGPEQRFKANEHPHAEGVR